MTQTDSSEPAACAQDGWLSPGRFALLLAALVFIAFPGVLLGWETFVLRDYGLFVYPLAYFQRECFWHGELPLWNPYINCGVPFLAQWNTMPLYPPALLYLLLPLGWSLAFFSLLHVWFAGMGMFFLAQRWAGNGLAAALAGVVFAFNGLSLNLLMWPSHIATLSWMPWVVLATERAWLRGGRSLILAALAGACQMLAGGPETILLTWLLVAGLWVLTAVCGPEMEGTDWTDWTDWTGAPAAKSGGGQPRNTLNTRNEEQHGGLFPRISRIPRFHSVLAFRLVLVVVLVFALAAVQLLPFLDLAAHSQRQEGFADTRWSLPASGWANFLVPIVFGSTWGQGVFYQYDQYWTSSYYLGLGTLLLAVFALFVARERRVWFLSAAAALGFIFALGDHTFVYPALRRLVPQLTLMTYPVKFVTVVIFAAPLLAGFCLARLRQAAGTQAFLTAKRKGRGGAGREADAPPGAGLPQAARAGRTQIKSKINDQEQDAAGGSTRSARLPFEKPLLLGAGILLLLVAGVLLWARSSPRPLDDFAAILRNGLSRAVLLAVFVAVLLVLGRAARPRSRVILSGALLLLLWLDLLTHEPPQNPTVPPSVYAPGVVRAELALRPQPALGESRVMVSPVADLAFDRLRPSDLRAGYLAKRLGYFSNCSLLDEVPKVNGFASLLPREFAVVNSLLYSSTNSDFPHIEDFLAVSHITAPGEFTRFDARPSFLPHITAGQQPIFLDDTNTLRRLFRPDFDPARVVYLPPDARPLVAATNQAAARVLSHRFTLRQVEAELESAAPSLTVVSQAYYHWWHAEVDGQPVPLLRANFAFQAVPIPAGRHHLRLVYEDRALQTGAILSLLALAACAVGWVRWGGLKIQAERSTVSADLDLNR